MDNAPLQFGPPPGPGTWELETAHFVRPLTRFVAEVYPAAAARGVREGTARYGLLLSHFDIVERHGFLFAKPVPFGAPPGAAGPPPRIVVMAATRLVPALRRRIKTSELAFENRYWREDLRRWDDAVKPRAVEAHRALQRVDPSALDAEALARHVAACRDHVAQMVAQHHSFDVAAYAPVGDFLAHVLEWTGKPFGELVEILKGASPVSLGVAAAEHEALADALRVDARARALLEETSGRDAGAVLAALRADEGEVGARARAFLDAVGYRSVGYDVCDPYALELPDVLVRALRTAVDRAALGRRGTPTERIDALRSAVPERHRARFDALLGEARLMHRLRDERGHYSDAWACGLARRALLAAGARLADRGALDDPELLVDATADEAAALLRGQRGPDAAALRARQAHRRAYTVADAPPHLGPPPSPPPPVEWLPPHGRRAARAIDAYFRGETAPRAPAPAARTPRSVAGMPASPGVYEGTARLVLDQRDFARVEQGDVLVARFTSPYFNVVLPLLGAIVTDRGGQLCHAAIVAREYGIPGVVGTTSATSVIPDGARVRVDGSTGEVRVLAS